MDIFKLKAKVLLTSEDQMETEERYDMGNIAKNKEWVWRNIAVPVDQIYKIIEFNTTKSIVELNDNEKVLVNEPFEELFDRWQKAIEYTERQEDTEEEESTQVGEEGEEEDEDD